MPAIEVRIEDIERVPPKYPHLAATALLGIESQPQTRARVDYQLARL
jgi:hypothetical protein